MMSFRVDSHVGLWLILLLATVSAYIWNINDDIPAGKIIHFSERFMFGTSAGPALLPQGDAFIEVRGTVRQWATFNRSVEVVFATYKCDKDKYEETLIGLCGSSTAMVQVINPWVSGLAIKRSSVGKFVSQSVLPSRLVLATSEDSGDSTVTSNLTMTPSIRTTSSPSIPVRMQYQWAVDVNWRFPVKVEGFQTVALALCADDSLAPVDGRLEGQLGFRNPYGYIQADSYGILPFESARMAAFLLLGLVLSCYYCRHWGAVLAVHKAVMTVYLFALTESILWFAVYQTLNQTGEPYCCPFPPLVTGSLVLMVFRQTLSRALLLVVALGYSIVRPGLSVVEWLGVGAVAVLYFMASLGAQISEIVSSDSFQLGSVSNAPQSPPLSSQLPALLMDALFLTWIFTALQSTHRVLKEHGQTHKLGIYNGLFASLAFFSTLFCATAVAFFLDRRGFITLPWQMSWMQRALWETLNFAVLATVSLLCLPSERARMLAYATQIPTEEPDEFADSLPGAEDDDEAGGGFGAFAGSLGSSKFLTAAEDSEDFDFDGKPLSRAELEMTSTSRSLHRRSAESDELESG